MPGIPEKLKTKDLTVEAAFWHHFINCTVIPSSNFSDVNVERAVLLYELLHDSNLNIAAILSDRIAHLITDGRSETRLAHCSLVYNLCMQVGVPIYDTDVFDIHVAQPYGHGDISTKSREVQRAIILSGPAGEGPSSTHQDSLPEELPASQPEQSQHPSSSAGRECCCRRVERSQRRVERSQHRMERRQRRMGQLVERMSRQMQIDFSGVDSSSSTPSPPASFEYDSMEEAD